MWAFFSGLLGFIDPISKITGQITDWLNKRNDAQTERDRIAADEQIKTLQARRDVLIAESQSPIAQFIKAWLVIPPSLYIAKLFVWDKMLGWGSTDDLSNNLWWIVFVIYTYYFLADVTKIVKR